MTAFDIIAIAWALLGIPMLWWRRKLLKAEEQALRQQIAADVRAYFSHPGTVADCEHCGAKAQPSVCSFCKRVQVPIEWRNA